jgi:hypothetical protein
MNEVSAQIVGAGQSGDFVFGHVLISGPDLPQEFTINAFTDHFSFTPKTDTPPVVLFQARQSDSTDHGFQDVFAFQVINTTSSTIRFRIRRLDQSSGFGQTLRVDILALNLAIN